VQSHYGRGRCFQLTEEIASAGFQDRHLVLYWGHYSGWPDLLVYRANQWFLAEVKSWRDKLNENQKRWIEDNHRYLHLPFKLVQVHRMESMSAPAA
jgi:VRR-NUC domain